MRRTLLAAAAGLAVSLPIASADAQMPVSFGILAGATLPTSDTGDSYDTGFNVGATLGFTPALMPVGLRIDGVYHNLGAALEGGEDLALFSVTANALLQIPTGAMTGLSPYLIGGIGLYSADFGVEDRQNKFGWNAGGGLRFALAGFSTFAEVRYNSFEAFEESWQFVPISFGIMF